MKNYYEKSIDILQKTNDGDDLHQQDLLLLETFCNADVFEVTEEMEVEFEELHTRICGKNRV